MTLNKYIECLETINSLLLKYKVNLGVSRTDIKKVYFYGENFNLSKKDQDDLEDMGILFSKKIDSEVGQTKNIFTISGVH